MNINAPIVIGKIKMKNKIIINEPKENINLNNYFILPYYDKNALVYIFIHKNGQIMWYNYNFKKIQSFKRIDKNLLKCYNDSKYVDHDIVIIGFIDKISTFRKLIIFDLLLKEEFNGDIQSKKYSTRVENFKGRFFTEKFNNIKNIGTIFTYKYDENIFNKIFSQCILTNKWEGYLLHKDCSFNDDIENEIIEEKVWETFSGIIIDATFGTIEVKDKDEKGEEINKSYEGVKSIFVMNEDKKLEISNGFTINERVQFFKDYLNLIGKEIYYKYFILNDKDITIFFKQK